MRKLLTFSVLALCLLVAIIFIRALSLDSAVSTSGADRPQITVDQGAVDRLSRAIRIKTVSADKDDARRIAAFDQLHSFLETEYPQVHSTLSKEVVNGHGLLYQWVGTNPSLDPVLLLSHQDVVPVEPGTEQNWQHPPFSGAIANGYVWGRGAWDDKSTLLASLEAVEALIGTGFKPERTLMLAFGHDEEIGGEKGAGEIARLLKAQGLSFELVLDEGAPITLGVMPGIEGPVANVAIAEKGYLTLRLKAESAGGHSSMPPPVTAIGRVAAAVAKLQDNPLPAGMNEPVRAMLTALAPELPLQRRLVLSNLWLFEPLVVRNMLDSKTTAALLRTSTAPTLFHAGVKDNVLPQSAEATVNFRIVPGETRASVIAEVKRIVADDQVAVEAAPGIQADASPVASVDGAGYRAVKQAIEASLPGVLVAPSLLTGATDSRYYTGLSDQVFRFTPIVVRPEDFKRIHGTNERIAVEDFENAIRFYRHLITETTGSK